MEESVEGFDADQQAFFMMEVKKLSEAAKKGDGRNLGNVLAHMMVNIELPMRGAEGRAARYPGFPTLEVLTTGEVRVKGKEGALLTTDGTTNEELFHEVFNKDFFMRFMEETEKKDDLKKLIKQIQNTMQMREEGQSLAWLVAGRTLTFHSSGLVAVTDEKGSKLKDFGEDGEEISFETFDEIFPPKVLVNYKVAALNFNQKESLLSQLREMIQETKEGKTMAANRLANVMVNVVTQAGPVGRLAHGGPMFPGFPTIQVLPSGEVRVLGEEGSLLTAEGAVNGTLLDAVFDEDFLNNFDEIEAKKEDLVKIIHEIQRRVQDGKIIEKTLAERVLTFFPNGTVVAEDEKGKQLTSFGEIDREIFDEIFPQDLLANYEIGSQSSDLGDKDNKKMDKMDAPPTNNNDTNANSTVVTTTNKPSEVTSGSMKLVSSFALLTLITMTVA